MLEKPTEHKSWPGKIPLHNVYTVGVGNERFLRILQKEGKLLASSCLACKKDFLPPKIFCPFCLSELLEWRPVPAKGTLETYTVAGKDIFAFIRLTSNGGLIHKLGEVSPSEVKIGLQVEAVFKSPAERKGSINDIEYFRPA